jgi:hypothetical protein
MVGSVAAVDRRRNPSLCGALTGPGPDRRGRSRGIPMPVAVGPIAAKAASRSRIRLRGALSAGNASRSCWAVHAAVGWAVTATCTTRRRSCARMTRRECAEHPTAGWPAPSCESIGGRPAERPVEPSRRRLFHLQKSRKPRRCQARTVSGLTITMASRHPQTCDSQTHSSRSA